MYDAIADRPGATPGLAQPAQRTARCSRSVDLVSSADEDCGDRTLPSIGALRGLVAGGTSAPPCTGASTTTWRNKTVRDRLRTSIFERVSPIVRRTSWVGPYGGGSVLASA